MIINNYVYLLSYSDYMYMITCIFERKTNCYDFFECFWPKCAEVLQYWQYHFMERGVHFNFNTTEVEPFTM